MKIDPNLNITEADVYAIRACMAGEATADQQKHAMQWIGAEACLLFEPEWQPGIPKEDGSHRGGRRYVGLLLSLMKEPEMLAHARKKPRGTPK